MKQWVCHIRQKDNATPISAIWMAGIHRFATKREALAFADQWFNTTAKGVMYENLGTATVYKDANRPRP